MKIKYIIQIFMAYMLLGVMVACSSEDDDENNYIENLPHNPEVEVVSPSFDWGTTSQSIKKEYSAHFKEFSNKDGYLVLQHEEDENYYLIFQFSDEDKMLASAIFLKETEYNKQKLMQMVNNLKILEKDKEEQIIYASEKSELAAIYSEFSTKGKDIVALAFSKYVESPHKGEIIETGAVDLGLSVKWAAVNVGADSPEQFGDYFSYAEVNPKKKYSFSNYSFSHGEIDFNCYTPKNIAGTRYDAAKKNMGDKWRTPSSMDYAELLAKCRVTYTTYKGTKGIKVEGRNGNSIFLPCSGVKTYSIDDEFSTYWVENAPLNTYYWIPAFTIFKDEQKGIIFEEISKSDGCCVRAICD